MFHKIGTPLFSFYNFLCWSISLCTHKLCLPTTMFLLTDLEHTTRLKSRTSTSYKNALWMSGISWISASLTKSRESGTRDFKPVWLQQKNSLNIRCEHISLLTFCHVLFLKGRLWLFTGW